MSAFIVSRQHIHQLVTALQAYELATETPTVLGQRLWDENIASVQYRYHGDAVENLPGVIGETYVYTYVQPQRLLTALEVHGLSRCYGYQACEHPGWEASEAYALTQRLEITIEAQLGATSEQIHDLPGYTWPDVDDDTPRLHTCQELPKPVRRISLTDTAKLVRKALKALWPTVKFSVRCSRYSMGQSIDVGWTDGPTHNEVYPLLQQFNGKQFDGMTDMASNITQEYEGERVAFGANYVQGQRELSTTFVRQIATQVAAQYKVAVPQVVNSGEKYGTGDHGYVPDSPEARVCVSNAPPFWREERLKDVIHHVAQQTSALAKPRIRLMPTVREIHN